MWWYIQAEIVYAKQGQGHEVVKRHPGHSERDPNKFDSQLSTASSFSYPRVPVKPPTTRIKCPRHTTGARLVKDARPTSFGTTYLRR